MILDDRPIMGTFGIHSKPGDLLLLAGGAALVSSGYRIPVHYEITPYYTNNSEECDLLEINSFCCDIQGREYTFKEYVSTYGLYHEAITDTLERRKDVLKPKTDAGAKERIWPRLLHFYSDWRSSNTLTVNVKVSSDPQIHIIHYGVIKEKYLCGNFFISEISQNNHLEYFLCTRMYGLPLFQTFHIAHILPEDQFPAYEALARQEKYDWQPQNVLMTPFAIETWLWRNHQQLQDPTKRSHYQDEFDGTGYTPSSPGQPIVFRPTGKIGTPNPNLERIEHPKW
jgi:hypothetical protein